MSEFRSALQVEVGDKSGEFILIAPLVYYSDILGRELIVPAKFPTDFASIPWMLRGLIRVNGKHRKAAVIHDWLCVYGWLDGVHQRTSDCVFLEAMRVLDVRWTQSSVMFMAVRLYQSTIGRLI